MPAPFLRKPTNYPSGISAGGGDTDFAVTRQITHLGVVLTGNQTRTITLPKGTIIISGISYPHHDGTSAAVPGTAGDVKVGVSGTLDLYLTLAAVEVYTRDPVTNGALLASDTDVIFTAVSVTGYCMTAVEVILPPMRP